MTYWEDGPESPEPTEQDYCGMQGHERYREYPETGDWSCYCGDLFYPLSEEPHDEYSAYCADLVDTYCSMVRGSYVTAPFDYTPPNLRLDIGLALRSKTPAYLRALIASLQSSPTQLNDSDRTELTELRCDFFVRIGVHLGHDGYVVALALIHAIGECEGFPPSERFAGNPDPYGVLDDEGNLELVRRALYLYVLLSPEGRGYHWQGIARQTLISMVPLLKKRPDVALEGIAAVFNAQGHSPSTIHRALAICDTDEPPAVPLMEGML